jgi:hypothetical protein
MLAVLALLYGIVKLLQPLLPVPTGESPATSSSEEIIRAGEQQIIEAYETRASGLMVGAAGTVDRILPDDEEGDRHQRFILRLESGHTLLISHNIDIAPRAPVALGDSLEFRGQYEWNERGGVVHWTHRDPDGNRPGGWIRHGGTLYR